MVPMTVPCTRTVSLFPASDRACRTDLPQSARGEADDWSRCELRVIIISSSKGEVKA